jgi:hypothetical protein
MKSRIKPSRFQPYRDRKRGNEEKSERAIMGLSLPPFPSTPRGEMETRTHFLETGLETSSKNLGNEGVKKWPLVSNQI